MSKIIIIGCPGTGKTTFAERLSKKTGLPLYYLDAIWHKADRTHISREQFDARIAEILAEDEWIIDGNYSRTMELRLRECDTVFLFDLPTDVCLLGATERLGKARYDLPWIDAELAPELKDSIENFSTRVLPNIYGLFDRYGGGREIHVFKSRDEADKFLQK